MEPCSTYSYAETYILRRSLTSQTTEGDSCQKSIKDGFRMSMCLPVFSAERLDPHNWRECSSGGCRVRYLGRLEPDFVQGECSILIYILYFLSFDIVLYIPAESLWFRS